MAARPDIRWAQIAGIGNVLRHEYHCVSDQLVWTVVEDYLPPLKRAILAIQVEVVEDEHG